MFRVTASNAEAVVKHAFWLAFKACLTNHVNLALEEEINSVTVLKKCKLDQLPISGAHKYNIMSAGHIFGCSLQMSLCWDDVGNIFWTGETDSSRQTWCRLIPGYEELIYRACRDLGAEILEEL